MHLCSAHSAGRALQLLGEKLYKLIATSKPSLAGKITGILLELDVHTLEYLVGAPSALGDKVDVILAALAAAEMPQRAAQPAAAPEARTAPFFIEDGE